MKVWAALAVRNSFAAVLLFEGAFRQADMGLTWQLSRLLESSTSLSLTSCIPRESRILAKAVRAYASRWESYGEHHFLTGIAIVCVSIRIECLGWRT